MADSLTVSLQGHDRFFARIIDTIPPDLYKHTVSEDADGAQEGKYAKARAWQMRCFLSNNLTLHFILLYLEPQNAFISGRT